MLNLVVYAKEKSDAQEVRKICSTTQIKIYTNHKITNCNYMPGNNETEFFNNCIDAIDSGFVQFLDSNCTYISPLIPSFSCITKNCMNNNLIDKRFAFFNYHAYIIDIQIIKENRFYFSDTIEKSIIFNEMLMNYEIKTIDILTVNFNFNQQNFNKIFDNSKKFINFIEHASVVKGYSYHEKIKYMYSCIKDTKFKLEYEYVENDNFHVFKQENIINNYYNELCKINQSDVVSISSFEDLLPGVMGISKNKLIVDGSNNILENTIVFIKPVIGNMGGTESLIKNIALQLTDTKIYVVGFKLDENSHYQFPKNVIELLAYEDTKVIQEILFTSKKNFVTSFTIFDQLLSTFAIPIEMNFYFLGDAKDFTIGGIYRVEYDYFSSYKDHIDNFYFISHENEMVFSNNENITNTGVIENVYKFHDSKIVSKRENFIYLSRIQRFAKNSHELITLGKKLHGKNICIDIYGTGSYLSEMLEEIKKYNLEDILIYKGILTNDHIETISTYRAMISLSTSEGFPTIFLEAFDANTPVICFDTFSSSKDAVNEKMGTLIEGRNYDKFTKTLKKYNTDEKYLKEKITSVNENKKYFEIDIISKMEEIND